MVLCTGSHRSAGRQEKAGVLPSILVGLFLISFMVIPAHAATTVTPQVSAGASSDGTGNDAHVLALRSDGTVWAWGDNYYDQLGLGSSSTATYSDVPVAVTGLTGTFIAVASGDAHSLALRNDGTVWAWGLNNYGQLGNTTSATCNQSTPPVCTYITNSATPVQVTFPANTTITAIAAGPDFSMALDSNGYVWTWGRNDLGQLGYTPVASNPPTAAQLLIEGTPTKNTTLANITGIAAGGFHALAVDKTNVAWAWGLDACGQLGDGVATLTGCSFSSNQVIANAKPTPQPITTGLTDVSSVGAGTFHSLAIMSDGSVKAWGWNGSGQLGNGNNTTDNSSPELVTSLTGATGVGAGTGHSVAIDGSNVVWTWGLNYQGQLGDKSTTNSYTPVNVLTGALGVTAAGDYTVAWKSDGSVWTWGDNSSEQLGIGATAGTTPTVSAPTQVSSFNLTTTSTTVLGDFNNDGKVNSLDALLCLQYAVGINSLNLTSAQALARGDMNRDGKINSVDALLILFKAVGL